MNIFDRHQKNQLIFLTGIKNICTIEEEGIRGILK